jgi:hypothetical protein
MKKSVREKIAKMSETIRDDSVQNVDQSFEDNENDQLSTFERSSLHENIIDQQIDSKTSDIFQTDLNEDSSNFHTDMNKSFDQRMSNLHTDMRASQSLRNLHTDMKESQSFDRQSSHSFRASQSFQSAISTTELFTLSREERSLFESIRSLINTSDNSLINSSIRSNEPRRHSAKNVLRVEIRSSQSRLMNQIDEISIEQISLEIIDIFERLNIADKIEKVREIVKEKGKAKEQFKSSKSSKSSSSRSIESSDLNSVNIIEDKRNRRSNLKYAQLIYEE